MAKLLIALEGGDGVGKSLLAQLLSTYFVVNGWKVNRAHFPDYSLKTGKKIRSFLDGSFGNPTELDPNTVSDWYYENRKEFYTLHRGWFRKVEVVILDRSHVSNLFYQGVKFFDRFPTIPDEISSEHESALSKLANYIWTQNEREQELMEYTQGALDRTIVIPLYLTNGTDEDDYPISFLQDKIPIRRRCVDLHDSNREYQKRIHDFAHLIQREHVAILSGDRPKFKFPILPPLYEYSIVKLPYEHGTLYDRLAVLGDAVMREILSKQASTRLSVTSSIRLSQEIGFYEQGSSPQAIIEALSIGGKTLDNVENTYRVQE